MKRNELAKTNPLISWFIQKYFSVLSVNLVLLTAYVFYANLRRRRDILNSALAAKVFFYISDSDDWRNS